MFPINEEIGIQSQYALRSVEKSDRRLSTVAAGTATEACQVLRIGREIGNTGIDYAACTLHQCGQPGFPTHVARVFENEPQPLLDKIAQLATT